MTIDCFAGEHSVNNPRGIAAFESAVLAIAAHRPPGAALADAVGADPHLVSAIAVMGLGQVMAGSGELMASAAKTALSARKALVEIGGGTAFEQALVEALEIAAHGHVRRAAARLEAYLEVNPRAFLCVKLAHALRFMSGQPDRMVSVTSHVLPAFHEGHPGYAYLLGCHAFGLEESGRRDEAEFAGRRAVELEPNDVWGLHAVAHVLEMRGRTCDGRAWLEPCAKIWDDCGNFGYHLAWHMGLYHLAEGDAAEALRIFDQHLVPSPTCDFRDVANAASMLWRLQQNGADIGDRWDRVVAVASARRLDTTYVFATLHYLLALLGARRTIEAHQLVAALENNASDHPCAFDQQRIAARVGVPLAQALLAIGEQRTVQADLCRIAKELPTIGGSDAQRDVFLRTLLQIAVTQGNEPVARSIGELRLAQRSEDRFQRQMIALLPR